MATADALSSEDSPAPRELHNRPPPEPMRPRLHPATREGRLSTVPSATLRLPSRLASPAEAAEAQLPLSQSAPLFVLHAEQWRPREVEVQALLRFVRLPPQPLHSYAPQLLLQQP